MWTVILVLVGLGRVRNMWTMFWAFVGLGLGRQLKKHLFKGFNCRFFPWTILIVFLRFLSNGFGCALRGLQVILHMDVSHLILEGDYLTIIGAICSKELNLSRQGMRLQTFIVFFTGLRCLM